MPCDGRTRSTTSSELGRRPWVTNLTVAQAPVDPLDVALTEIVADFPQIDSVDLLRKPTDWRGHGESFAWVYWRFDLPASG